MLTGMESFKHVKREGTEYQVKQYLSLQHIIVMAWLLISIIMIIIGFCLTVVVKIGPCKETSWLFGYGELPLLLIAAAIIIPGMVLYNKNR